MGESDAALESFARVSEGNPTYVEARHVAAIAHLGLEQFRQMRAHVSWLLEHARDTDVRRRTWNELLR